LVALAAGCGGGGGGSDPDAGPADAVPADAFVGPLANTLFVAREGSPAPAGSWPWMSPAATIDVGADARAVVCYGPDEGPSPPR
jgi:hypothetical protein